VDQHELEELRDQALQLYIEAHERRQPAERSRTGGHGAAVRLDALLVGLNGNGRAKINGGSRPQAA
jgi:hypothetical protein